MSIKVTIYKDNWIASRPWCADLETSDGFQIRSWMQCFRTKKDMLREILSVRPDAVILNG